MQKALPDKGFANLQTTGANAALLAAALLHEFAEF
jgi:hypothetical protein